MQIFQKRVSDDKLSVLGKSLQSGGNSIANRRRGPLVV